MEEKEKEVHHKLRQHFGEKKFSSRVEIKYADTREDVQPYKSRYSTGPNRDLVEAFKAQNLHNSKIY